ncbi:hypothetical protein G7Y89_g4766 [Cudoniella acicularis]|uniref:JmjC domain-containing protein n=1 Tax=Cudoniella acicularis TaxID=354080 RepID=A0A8H4W4M7_9HELO|nr:hypothetical protein G7Y89_g4766 [Cudoniella acicularis]
MDPAPQDPITALLQTYNSLNSPHIPVLTEEPSPLEFHRYVALNRPFVVRGGAKDWEACQDWNVAKLKEVMEGRSVNVAVTPLGNADSPTSNANENDNLRNEYLPLSSALPPSIPFARIALAEKPEAINFWLGNSFSTTALHKDPYQNIYVQIAGEKHFVLFPPIAFPFVKERLLRSAVYERDGEGELVMREEDEEAEKIPVTTWDPDADPDLIEDGKGEEGRWADEKRKMCVRVTLRKGDMLYLPALWYHKVSQSCDEEGICCAVNYWHDMEFSGSFYPLCNLVRDLVLAGAGKGNDEREQKS